jgi:SAM-dependent methyltransferase
MTKQKTSALATELLSNLHGIEIGASAHNPFNLNTKNVDYTDDYSTVFKREEFKICGEYAKVDIVANGDELPLEDNSQDFVISSHVIEHFWDPVKAIKEWMRVTKEGGYIYIICPHKFRTFDIDREITHFDEIISRHGKPMPPDSNPHQHWSVWDTQAFIDLCNALGWNIYTYQDIDDKVGNGFAVVLKV